MRSRGHFETGNDRRFAALVRDVSEREAALAALRRNEERFRTLIDRSASGILVHRAGRPIYVNDALVAMFGYASTEEVLALDSTLLLFHPDERVRLRGYARARLEGEEVPPVYEVRGITKEGSEIIIDNSAAAVQWDGEVAVCATMVDITDYRRTQEALQQLQKMEAVGQLAVGVAHDFNNLLTVMLGNLEMIAAAPEIQEHVKLRRWTRTSRRAAQSGADLTRRLLTFSRRQVLDPATVKPNKVIAGMTDMLARTLGEDIELTTRLDAHASAIHVDAAQLESAILNLAVNARDAMPIGGELIIEVADRELDAAHSGARADVAPGHYVMVEVTDSGAGMSHETLKRVFEPFYTTKEVGKGTGLGLSMVYGFVRQSGGHAAIYSEPGHGTTVRLYFPARAAGSVIEHVGGEAEERALGDEVVLVAEDDEQVRETAATMLEALGYQVLTAETGPLALETLVSHPEVDLLFTDVIMPGGMTGPDLAREALRRRPDLKVLYTSGYAESALRSSGGAPDATWLAKPYAIRRLAEKVRVALSEGEEPQSDVKSA